jgi:hypothetical protein
MHDELVKVCQNSARFRKIPVTNNAILDTMIVYYRQ